MRGQHALGVPCRQLFNVALGLIDIIHRDAVNVWQAEHCPLSHTVVCRAIAAEALHDLHGLVVPPLSDEGEALKLSCHSMKDSALTEFRTNNFIQEATKVNYTGRPVAFSKLSENGFLQRDVRHRLRCIVDVNIKIDRNGLDRKSTRLNSS